MFNTIIKERSDQVALITSAFLWQQGVMQRYLLRPLIGSDSRPSQMPNATRLNLGCTRRHPE